MKVQATNKASAYRFVFLLGFVSLFSDMTYESARSITGPFLAMLGASGMVVGIIAGLGELLGFGLRIISGYVAKKASHRWPLTIFGYLLNLLAVPPLALAHSVSFASTFIIAERVGKAIRSPPRDTMLSFANRQIGMGLGFGIHQAMDQFGAMSGPLLMALVLFLGGSYQFGFALLLIPAIFSLSFLTVTYKQYLRSLPS